MNSSIRAKDPDMISLHPDPFPVPDYASRFAPSYWDEVGDWFRVVGGAHLRSLDELPDALDLADWLLETARAHEPRGVYPGTGWRNVKGLARDELIDRAEENAAWLLKNHKPRRRRFTREQAATGGKASRRPKILLRRYVRLLADLEATGEVLGLAEIAVRLGCARQSVYRLRDQAEALGTTLHIDLTPSAEPLDALISGIDPVSTPDPGRNTAMDVQNIISIKTRQPMRAIDLIEQAAAEELAEARAHAYDDFAAFDDLLAVAT